jgi:hypothetical protein
MWSFASETENTTTGIREVVTAHSVKPAKPIS